MEDTQLQKDLDDILLHRKWIVGIHYKIDELTGNLELSGFDVNREARNEILSIVDQALQEERAQFVEVLRYIDSCWNSDEGGYPNEYVKERISSYSPPQEEVSNG